MKSKKNLLWMIGIFTVAYGVQAVACPVTLHNNTKQPVWLILDKATHKSLKDKVGITEKALPKKVSKIAAGKKRTFKLPISTTVAGKSLPGGKKFYLYSKNQENSITYHLSVFQKWCAAKTKPTVLTMSALIAEKTPDPFVVKYNKRGIHERIHSGFKNLKSSFTGWFSKLFGK